MAKFYAQDFSITVAGTNLSGFINSAELTLEADELEVTAFGTAWRERIAGLRTGSVQLDFMQDYASSSVEATLYPLLGTIATVVIKPTSGTVSATNPSYTIPCLVTQHTPIAGAVGDVATFSVTWPTSGTVTKGTA